MQTTSGRIISPRWCSILTRAFRMNIVFRPENHVRAQALGGGQAGTLANDHADHVGADYFAEMVFDSDPRISNEHRLQEPVSRRKPPGERAEQWRRVLLHRGR